MGANLRHDVAALSHVNNPRLHRYHHGETNRRNFSRFMLRNPLKSLDSDERIQGNPAAAKEGVMAGLVPAIHVVRRNE
jgi:hypothetical protein